METSAYFDDIPKQIAKWLRSATREIVVAVAWFTDQDLFDLLCRRAGQGVWVRLAVLNDRINVGPGRLNFQRLQDIGGEVFLIPAVGRNAIMHHKFCVIDGETVIVGSYNWTNRAQDNDENITVICDAAGIGADYLRAFENLLSKHELSTPIFDTTQIRQRLEVLRTLLKLADWDSVDLQIERIRPAVAAMRLSPLIEFLERRSADAATAWLDRYLARATALADAMDQEIAFLKLELRSLEFRVTALSDERAEIERQIHEFSQRSTHAFGELMTRYLELRAKKHRRRAEPCARTLNAGLALITSGLAWHYKRYAHEQSEEDRERYAFAEVEARAGQAGLWRDPDPVPPWEWRRR